MTSFRWPAAALGALTIARLAAAASAPLAPDEAYYWVWSRALAPGYLDHPPMAAWWIAAGTAIAGDTALGVRLLGPFAAALGTWLLADAANRLLPGRGAGWTAGALLNATLFLGAGSVLATPDTPLLLFWTAAIWAAARIAGGGARGVWWPVLGLVLGLAFLSKYTAGLLWAGIGLWVLLSPPVRAVLRGPWPWAAGALCLATAAPVALWNAAHAWAGFARQGGRLADWRPERALQFLAELVGSQIGLATPGVWLLCMAGIAAAARQAWRTRDTGWILLACLTLPGCALFLQHALGDRVQGNWPAIVYPAAAIAAARLAAPLWIRLRRPAIALGLGIACAAQLHAATGALPIPARFDPVALRMRGWDTLARAADEARQAGGLRTIAADKYATASELAWHLPRAVPVAGVEDRWRHFELPPPDMSAPVLLVRDLRDGPPDPAIWTDAERVGEADRAGVQRFALYRALARPGASAARLNPSPVGPTAIKPP